MAFNANSLEQTLSSQQRAEATTARRICILLDEAITEARRVCRGLYPVRLKTEGLVPALEELAHTVTERFGLRCECHLGTRRLLCDITTATHLYRIAQEAVNNAVKHSGAHHIHLRLDATDGALELEIQDDGTGFKMSPGSGGGMGLHIMDYRARTIGGSLEIQDTGTGTKVSCRVAQRTANLTSDGEAVAG
jgi:signal transduction histidine kinase